MAQGVKCLSHEQENLRVQSLNTQQKASCIVRLEAQHWSGGDEQLPGAPWRTSLEWGEGSRPCGRGTLAGNQRCKVGRNVWFWIVPSPV